MHTEKKAGRNEKEEVENRNSAQVLTSTKGRRSFQTARSGPNDVRSEPMKCVWVVVAESEKAFFFVLLIAVAFGHRAQTLLPQR